MPQPKLKVQLKKFHEAAQIPEYQSLGAAAFDLHACLPDVHGLQIAPGDVVAVPTGIGVFLDNTDYGLFIWERSGLGKKGIERRGGLVDSDYQGEIMVLIDNDTNGFFSVRHGDRIAQAVVQPIQRVQFEVVDEFPVLTERGSKGFGSSGMR